jgi:hypothetical protein
MAGHHRLLSLRGRPATRPGRTSITGAPRSPPPASPSFARAGVDLGDDPSETLSDVLDDDDDLDLVIPLADERLAALPALLAGRIFTHRVGVHELEHDLLTINPDLVGVSALAESYQQTGRRIAVGRRCGPAGRAGAATRPVHRPRRTVCRARGDMQIFDHPQISQVTASERSKDRKIAFRGS